MAGIIELGAGSVFGTIHEQPKSATPSVFHSNALIKRK